MCERFLKQAEDECTEAMDEQCRIENDGVDCEHDGDFHEGLGVCIYDGTLHNLIDGYNKRNPKKKINCDDVL